MSKSNHTRQPPALQPVRSLIGRLKQAGALAFVVAALAACQSGGGSASLNADYSSLQGCNSYDYSNTELGLCPGRMWH